MGNSFYSKKLKANKKYYHVLALILFFVLGLYGTAESEWEDVSSDAKIIQNRPFYNFADQTTYFDVSIQNITANDLLPTLRLVIESITPPGIVAHNADGVNADGKSYFDFDAFLDGDHLVPGETSLWRRLEFDNPLRRRFLVEYKLLVDQNDTNSPPQANAGFDQTVIVGERVHLDGSGSTDTDGDLLAFHWQFFSTPEGSSAELSDPNSLMPFFDVDLYGIYEIELVVNDNQVDSLPDIVRITTQNSPPIANAGLDQSIFTGETVFLDGSGSRDVDHDPLTFHWSFVSTPPGSKAIISDTMVISPYFEADVFGSYIVRLIVNDGIENSEEDKVTINTVNSRPVANAGPDVEVALNSLVVLDGTESNDVDLDPISYRWALVSIPENSRVVLSESTTATPFLAIDRKGSYVVQLIVNDGTIDSLPDTLRIDVPNSPPQIISAPQIETSVGINYIYEVNAIDPDVEDLLFFSLEKGPQGMSLNLDSGVLQWTPDSEQQGEHEVVVKVNDPEALYATQSFSILVSIPNEPPQITSTPVTAAKVGTPYKYNVYAFDPNRGDTLRFSLDEAPPNMEIGAESGKISWTPTPDDPRTPAVTVMVRDQAGLFDSQSFGIMVQNSVLANGEPIITSQPVLTHIIGLDYWYSVTAMDPEDNPLSYSMASAPTGMTIDNNTGRIYWAAPGKGAYPVALVVRDTKGGQASQSYILNVTEPNLSPQINSVPEVKALSGVPYSYPVEANDPNGDDLIFSLTQAPSGMGIDDLTGEVSWTPDAGQIGEHLVAVQVSDPDGLMASQSYILMVETDTNDAPIADAGLDQWTPPGITITLDGSRSSDPNGDPITYQWSFEKRPEGSNTVLSDSSAVFPSFSPDVMGIYTLKLIVHDGRLDSLPNTVRIIATSQITVGDSHACALTKDGGAVCWGSNNSGQLGIGSFGPRDDNITTEQPNGIPYPVSVVSASDGLPLTDIKEISATGSGNCVLTGTGGVKCWGWNFNGIVGDGTDMTREAAVDVVVEEGGEPLTGIVDIDVGGDHACAVTENGTVKCWGWGAHGQLGNDDLISGGVGDRSLVPLDVLLESGGEPLDGVIAVSTGGVHSCALMDDSTVKCWGNNDWGQLGNGAELEGGQGNDRVFFPVDVLLEPGGEKLTGAVAISAGNGFTCALMEDGGIRCWGVNYKGELGDGTIGESATNPADGTISTTPVDVVADDQGTPLKGAVAVSAGYEGGCAIMEDTGIKCWGSGYLGNGTHSTIYYVPIDVLAGPGQGPLKGATDVAVGWVHTCAALENGEIKCWGDNGAGQLGNGDVATVVGTSRVYSPPLQFYPVNTLVGQNAVLVSLSVSPDGQILLKPGDFHSYKAMGIFSDASTEDLTGTVSWDVDDPEVATVNSDGMVIALKSGITTIRVSYEGLFRNVKLIVANSELAGIVVSPENAFVLSTQNRDSSGCLINDPNPCRPLDFSLTEKQFTAMGIFSDGSRMDLTGIVTWKSSSQDASVGQDGLAIGTGLGKSTISAQFNDLTGSGALNVSAVVDEDTTPPVVSLTPDDNTHLLGLTDILGKVQDDNLVEYKLAISKPSEIEYRVIDSGTTPFEGIVTSLDTSTMENGLYNVKLSATDQGGNSASVTRAYRVQDQAKIGLFTLSFVDLSIPVSGIPIEIIRTYDSQVKSFKDFGVGWNLEIRRGSFKHNRPPGEGWQILQGGGIFGLPCQFISETASHITEVRLSDNEYYRFKLVLSEPAALSGGCTAEARFEFIDGTVPGATLDILDGTSVFYENATNQVLKIGTAATTFNPNRVRLTTPDGRIIEFDNQAGGVVRVEDINGNALDITDTGIIHSSGKGIDLTRDSAGRITEITDPMGNTIEYDYDGVGDLVAFTDQEGHQITFSYDSLHYLIDIYDPLGNRAIRNEYDASGRLIATLNPDGNRREMTHDIENRREAITDSLGRVTVHEYDEQGNVLVTIDALGNQTNYTYDANGNELTVTDPLENVTTNTYDASYNLLTKTDPLGNTITSTYTTRNQLQSITDPLGNTTTYIYPITSGNLEGITDPLDNTTGMGYDRTGNLSSMTDPLGNTTSFTYDSAGNRITEIDPLGKVTTYTFDDNGNELTASVEWTGPDGNPVTLITTKEYDALNRVFKVTDPLGNVSRTEYNAIGKVSAEVDKLGRRTEYKYDNRGNIVRTLYPDGTEERLAFDSEGNQVSTTDRAGRTTNYVYDALNRLIETIFPDGSSTRTFFDASGREVAVIDANGHETNTDYDAAGNRVAVIDALGNEIRFSYDEAGRQTGITDAAGNLTTFEYDAAGRRTRMLLPDGTATNTVIDVGGRLTSKIDVANNSTGYEYNERGHLVAVVDALGSRTTYGYDEQGNMVSQTDANGNTTHYEYNGLGQRTATVLPMGQRSSTNYDALGNVLGTTDFNGDTISYTYDADNRLVTKQLPDNTTVTFTYTPSGQRQTVTDIHGVTRYFYDEMDRLSSRTDPNGESIAYAYDSVGNRTSVTTVSGVTSYNFDALNRIESVTAPDGGMTVYTYDARGNLATTNFPNATRETRTYDIVGRLLSVVNSHVPSDTVISSFDYIFDALGNRVAVDEDNGRLVEYGYDALSRLTRETIFDPDAITPSRTVAYTYDSVGNRLERNDSQAGITVYNYDANDRLLTETTEGISSTFQYDNNGNTLAKATASTTVSYSWDGENRLIAADINGDGTSEIGYSYNADGIRIAKIHNGNVTKYLIDANRPYAQVLEEVSPTGGSSAAYVYGNDLIAQQRSGKVSYYHVDGLGSTRALTNANGAMTDRYIFSAYGQTIGQTGNTENLYLYAGEQRDPDIGLDYLRARYLDVEIGRFVGKDPFEGLLVNPISRQPYLYVNNSPVNAIDPSGKVTLLSITIGQNIKNDLRAINVSNIGSKPKEFITGISDLLSITSWALDVVLLFNTLALDIELPGIKVKKTLGEVKRKFDEFSNLKSATYKIDIDNEGNRLHSISIVGKNDLGSNSFKKGTGKGTNLSAGFTIGYPDYRKSSINIGAIRKWNFAEALSLTLSYSSSLGLNLNVTPKVLFKGDIGNGRFTAGLEWDGKKGGGWNFVK